MGGQRSAVKAISEINQAWQEMGSSTVPTYSLGPVGTRHFRFLVFGTVWPDSNSALIQRDQLQTMTVRLLPQSWGLQSNLAYT